MRAQRLFTVQQRRLNEFSTGQGERIRPLRGRNNDQRASDVPHQVVGGAAAEQFVKT
jgi:hypothetical protein